MKELINKIIKSDQNARQAIISDYYNEALNIDALQKKLDLFRDNSKYLKSLSIFMFFVIIVNGLLTNAFFLLRTQIHPYVILAGFGVLIAIYVSVITEVFVLAHRFYPKGSYIWLKNLGWLIFIPPLALKATSALFKDVLYSGHRLTLARILLPQNEFLRIARMEWYDANSNAEEKGYEDDPKALYLTNEARIIEAMISKSTYDIKMINKKQDREETTSTRYCPRCFTEYTNVATRCSDCGCNLNSF